VFESDQGVYLVDAGWNTDDAYNALEAGLATAGYTMADVRGVMVTHIHPDHYGLAGRVREACRGGISLPPPRAPLTAGWGAGCGRRPGRGSRCTPPTPGSSRTATSSPPTCSSGSARCCGA